MTQAFYATEEEIGLATEILASLGLDTDTGALQGEQAREIFTRSALPPTTLRDIWKYSDTNGNGELSKHEISMALRLIGWVQSGESLRSGLLAKVGPLPTLDGIADVEYKRSREDDVPQITVFPAVNEEQLRKFSQAFINAGPLANGFVNGDKVLDVYMSSNLSYGIIQDIINLVARTSQTSLNFAEFACGLYLIKALKSSQLHAVPIDLPPDLFDQFQEPPPISPPIPLSEPLQPTRPVPPKLMTPAPSRTPSFTSPSTLTKKQPPPVPPKRRDSLLKDSHSPPIYPKYSATTPPQLSPSASSRSVERSPSFSSSQSSISLSNSLSSPFEDPMESETQPLSKIPESRTQSPPLPLPLLPPPPPPPPPDKVHQETLNRLRDEISMLSKQVESLLIQLEAQNLLRETNEALRLENEILKTQVKDTERMMSEVLSANESESVGSQEEFAQEITRLMGELEEKETRCSDHHRRISVLSNEERELREKLRESEGTLAKSITEIAEYRQVIDSKKEEIDDLKERLSVMTKELSDESESSRGGSAGMSHRELRVFIRDVTKENEGLKGQVRDMERSMEQILLSTRHAKYNEIQGENRKLRMQMRELESVVTQLQTSVSPSASQVQQVDNVAKENGKLRSQLQDGKRAYADYRSTSETKIVDLEQKLEALKQENTRLKVDIHAATEGRREEGTVPPPGYDEPFVAPPP